MAIYQIGRGPTPSASKRNTGVAEKMPKYMRQRI